MGNKSSSDENTLSAQESNEPGIDQKELKKRNSSSSSLNQTNDGHQGKTNVGIQTTNNNDLDDLSDGIRSLLEDEQSSDVTLVVSGRTFRAHSVILKARSPVFDRMFQHDMVERRSGHVDIPDCDPGTFGVYLRFLYSGSFEGITDDNARELAYIANKYGSPKLWFRCLDFMQQNLTVGSFCGFVTSVLREGSDEVGKSDFLKAGIAFFANHFEEICESPAWKDFFKESPLEANELMLNAYKACFSRSK